MESGPRFTDEVNKNGGEGVTLLTTMKNWWIARNVTKYDGGEDTVVLLLRYIRRYVLHSFGLILGPWR